MNYTITTRTLFGLAMTVFAAHAAADEQTSGVKPTESEARHYCEDAAASLNILAEELEDYMTECMSEYMAGPPDELGSSPEPGGTGY